MLRSTGLPAPVVAALGIWTHVAAQRLDTAPSPMALVPAIIHGAGAFYPRAGIGSIPRLLAERALASGVKIRCNTRVKRLLVVNKRARGVVTEANETLEADAVISNAHGIGTYLELLEANELPAATTRKLRALPLQSPGVIAYLAVKGDRPPCHLQFQLDEHADAKIDSSSGDNPHRLACRLFIAPAVVEPSLVGADGWWPARLLAPLDHQIAERLGATGQRQCLERLLDENWWRSGLIAVRVLSTRIPVDWGKAHQLHRDSMNPSMTRRFMLEGRLAHRSPFIKGLYLAGSSTHPGQWVSFAAISGLLAADQLLEDLHQG